MANEQWPGLARLRPKTLADDLDSRGVVRVAEAFSPGWLADMRAMVRDAIGGAPDGSDVYLDHADRESSSPARQLTSDPIVRALFGDTVACRRPRRGFADEETMRSSMLIRRGGERSAPSNMFHYDPCVLTMVIPIVIPHNDFGTCGELVAAPNVRPYRRSHLRHLVDKVITHNTLHRTRFARDVAADPHRFHVPLTPGEAVFFWGYRTFHGNLDCAPGQNRATLVVKFGRVHAEHGGIAAAAWSLSRSGRHLRRFQAASA